MVPLDPLSAVMNALSATLTLAGKVWDATPQAQQQAAASDWATFTHNIGSFFLHIQEKVNAKL